MSPIFTPFTRLPTELRQEIWKHALPDLRIIQCSLRDKPESTLLVDSTLAEEYRRQWFAKSPCLSTNIHLVNKEARDIFLEIYSTTEIIDETTTSRKPTMQIRFRRDIMFFEISNPSRQSSSLFTFRFDWSGVSPWHSRVKNVALDLLMVLHPQRPDEGFRELYFHPEKRAVPIIERILKVFPALEQLYLIVDGTDPNTEAPRRMVDPMDSEKYACWNERMGRHRAMNWIPGTVAALQQKRNAIRPLKISLKLFVNRSSPCGTTNRSVTEAELFSEGDSQTPPELTMCWRYRQGQCVFRDPAVLQHEHTGTNCTFWCCSRRPL